jgi:hypothetical protein
MFPSCCEAALDCGTPVPLSTLFSTVLYPPVAVALRATNVNMRMITQPANINEALHTQPLAPSLELQALPRHAMARLQHVCKKIQLQRPPQRNGKVSAGYKPRRPYRNQHKASQFYTLTIARRRRIQKAIGLSGVLP